LPVFQITQRPGDVRPPCAPTVRDPNLLHIWHPDSFVLRNRVLREEKPELFESEEEEFALTGISAPGLRRVVDSLRPGERRDLLDEIQQELPRGVRKRVRRLPVGRR
jgi:hypothetical protein